MNENLMNDENERIIRLHKMEFSEIKVDSRENLEYSSQAARRDVETSYPIK